MENADKLMNIECSVSDTCWWCRESGTGAGFTWINSVFPCHYHSTIAPYSFIHLPPTVCDLSNFHRLCTCNLSVFLLKIHAHLKHLDVVFNFTEQKCMKVGMLSCASLQIVLKQIQFTLSKQQQPWWQPNNTNSIAGTINISLFSRKLPHRLCSILGLLFSGHRG